MMDPITLAALAQGVTGITQSVIGFKDRKRAKNMLYGENGQGGLMNQATPTLQTPDMYRKMYESAARSKAYDAEKTAADQRMSNLFNTLGSGRERAALLSGATRQHATDLAGAAGRQQQQEMQAGNLLAQAQMSTNQFNTQAAIDRQNLDKNIALQGYQGGTETALSGLGSGLQGLGSFAGLQFGSNDGKEDFLKYLGVPSGEDGGSFRLEGEYDHETNPKYVVNKEGDVEAEMTGDETLVFNPEQRDFLKSIIFKLMKTGEINQGEIDPEEAREVFSAFMK